MNRYQGGKNGAGVYQAIINRIPVHDVYVEAFAGSAAIYRKKKPAASSLLVERDPEQVSRLAVLASSSTTIHGGDAVLELESLVPASGAGVFVYLDPPYVHAARKDLSLYRYEMTDAQHHRLVASVLPALSDRGVLWMLSGYRNAIYAEASSLHGWHTHDFTAMTRRGPATETLWMNYDPAAAVIAEPTYAGDTFRERERIKRKAARWAANFAAMPAAERAAVMAMLQPHLPQQCGT